MDAPYFYTWSKQNEAKSLNINGGKGVRFTCSDGSTWLDFGALSYQANLGYGNTRIQNAMKSQCDRLLLTVPNADFPEKIELANKLLAQAPSGFSKVFFTLGGAEAIENAIKMARLFTGRYKTLSRYRSYHGATMGALSLSGDFRRAPLEPALPGAIHVLDCYESRLPGGANEIAGGGSAEAIERTLALEENIGAVFLEPVPGANGVLVPPQGYWESVRASCDKHGALLVADCVLNGFGRLGTWYGYEAVGKATPDIITLSKGLTAGYAPLGAVLVHDKIAKHFDDHFLYAGLTFYGHPIGIAAGLEAVNIYTEEKSFEHVAQTAPVFASEIAALQDAHPHLFSRTRVLGLLGGFEMKREDLLSLSAKLANAHLFVHTQLSNNTLILSPPIVISGSELKEGFEIMRQSCSQMT